MALRNDIDPDGLLEYSVVFTDRSLNHMSLAFQQVMREIHATLCGVHGAYRAVIAPGDRGLIGPQMPASPVEAAAASDLLATGTE